jgi:hypothetical protein
MNKIQIIQSHMTVGPIVSINGSDPKPMSNMHGAIKLMQDYGCTCNNKAQFSTTMERWECEVSDDVLQKIIKKCYIN